MMKSFTNSTCYILRKYVAPGLAVLTGRKRYTYYSEMKSVPALPHNQIEKMQQDKLQYFLSYAAEHVPFYNNLSDVLKVTENVDVLSFLKYFPIITKKTIHENMDQMVSRKYTIEELSLGYSGGSTGSLLKYYFDKALHEKSEAVLMRMFSWGGWSPADPVAMFWGGFHELRGRDQLSTRLKRFISGRFLMPAYTYNDEIIRQWLKIIEKYEIRYLYGYASVFYNISLFQKRTGVRLPKINAIFSTAETLLPHYRSTIENAFQCKVYNQYGSREVQGIACECEKGNMHINSDLVYPEFIPDNSGDNIHRLVVTSFLNFGMPFIRYDIGDYASPKEGLCGCGRGFPLMSMHIGRTNDHLRKPDGEIIYPSYFNKVMFGIDGVSLFQFRQKDFHNLQLRLVLHTDISVESRKLISNLETRIRRELDWDVALEVHEVDKIELPPSGKHRYVICELDYA
ncbi:MAG: hypothetical protein K9J79_05925 [Desulfobacteraceae bacterium]|nr:hypothetical protein [Desulfobacteraceae bacterium]